MTVPFPSIDPVAFSIGPVPIRWYALSYIGGLAAAWFYCTHLLKKPGLWPAGRNPAAPMTPTQFDDLIYWVGLGVLGGGRLGYLLFYEPNLLIAPWEHLGAGMSAGILKTLFGWIYLPPALMLWNGGMSFHGGLIGVIIAGVVFSRRNSLPILSVGDLFACGAPLGSLFGRLANFVNGELYGRPWNGSWAMVFPSDPLGVPRHPSQLYEAALEGFALFAIVAVSVWAFKWLRRPGATMGLFLFGYGLSRIIVENFREPDAHMPNFPFGLTMGMLLSAPMLAAGAYFLWKALRPSTPARASIAAS